MKSKILVSKPLIDTTLAYLRAGGAKNVECVVLWLAERQDRGQLVKQVYLPLQRASSDFFRIPPAGMEDLMRVLDQEELFVAAQVHSHPAQAFHSLADDTWAIVRHQGALSIVIPWFASRTSPDTFFKDAATFSLDAKNQWCEIPTRELEMAVTVIP